MYLIKKIFIIFEKYFINFYLLIQFLKFLLVFKLHSHKKLHFLIKYKNNLEFSLFKVENR